MARTPSRRPQRRNTGGSHAGGHGRSRGGHSDNVWEERIKTARQALKLIKAVNPILGRRLQLAFEFGCGAGKLAAYLEIIQAKNDLHWKHQARILFGPGGARGPAPAHGPAKPTPHRPGGLAGGRGDYNATKPGYVTVHDSHNRIVKQTPIPGYVGPKKGKPHFINPF